MKVLYIWDGRHTLPDNRKAAVKATLDIYPEAECICISQFPEFYSSRFTMLDWFDIKDKMKAFLGLSATPYAWNHYMAFSDWARFWFLGHNPGSLYLDTDAKMLKRYDFDREHKALYSENNICALYSPANAKGENFLDMIQKRAKKNIGLLLDFHAKFGAWAKPLPAEYFQHKAAA